MIFDLPFHEPDFRGQTPPIRPEGLP
jgi:hypothetical protein